MWSIRKKEDGSFYLVFDKGRRYNPVYRGLWEFIGKQDALTTAHCVRINQEAGYYCLPDNEGSMRVLVLE